VFLAVSPALGLKKMTKPEVEVVPEWITRAKDGLGEMAKSVLPKEMAAAAKTNMDMATAAMDKAADAAEDMARKIGLDKAAETAQETATHAMKDLAEKSGLDKAAESVEVETASRVMDAAIDTTTSRLAANFGTVLQQVFKTLANATSKEQMAGDMFKVFSSSVTKELGEMNKLLLPLTTLSKGLSSLSGSKQKEGVHMDKAAELLDLLSKDSEAVVNELSQSVMVSKATDDATNRLEMDAKTVMMKLADDTSLNGLKEDLASVLTDAVMNMIAPKQHGNQDAMRLDRLASGSAKLLEDMAKDATAKQLPLDLAKVLKSLVKDVFASGGAHGTVLKLMGDSAMFVQEASQALLLEGCLTK
jgi:hypothetical protein